MSGRMSPVLVCWGGLWTGGSLTPCLPPGTGSVTAPVLLGRCAETRGAKQSPSMLLVSFQPLLTCISESPGPVVSPAPAQQRRLGESCTLRPCLVGQSACSLAPGQPWLALPAQHPWDLAAEKAMRLSCVLFLLCSEPCPAFLFPRAVFRQLCRTHLLPLQKHLFSARL